MRRVTVGVQPPYDVLVGAGILGAVSDLVADRRRVVVVTHAPLAERYAGSLAPGADGEPWIELISDGEAAKSLSTVEALCRAFASGGLLRGDAVVALGGGVVGDTAGFAAAIYHRGVAVVQVPTTLLSQVDAAIGGKTAVNLPEGKNLVGAFHQPIGVVADTETLASLPERDFRCGLGEVAKYALMPQGGAIVDLLRLRVDRVLARDPEVLGELVAECAAIKAAVVAADPGERTGLREHLNYGHTLAHALETAFSASGVSASGSTASGADDLAHGEAVAIGLVFDANLAHALERVGLDVVDRVHGVVAGLGLPTEVPGEIDAGTLDAVMRRDKKATGGLAFVLPGPDGLERVEDPPERALDHAFRAVGVER
jgi:3-dehydroquinate synthetase